MATSVCSKLSRTAVPLATARSLCTGTAKVSTSSTPFQLRLTVQSDPSLLPLSPSKAGRYTGLRRYASGFLSSGASSAGRAAASDWTSTFGVDSLFNKFSKSPNELLLESIVPGPPSEVVPFVFAEASDLSNERFYPPYFLELLVSWQARPVEFEQVFWKTLKQQVTGTYELRQFVAFFLIDRKTAVGGLTGSKLGRRFEGVFLEEGRCNPVAHQLDGLYEVFSKMGHHEHMKHDSKQFLKLCKRFEAARDANAAAALRVGARFPREEPPWRTATRATPGQGREVRPVALLEEKPPEDASDESLESEAPETDTGLPTDGSDQLAVPNQPLAVNSELPRDEFIPTHVGHPEDVVPFVFGEASDLDNQRHYRPLMKELLTSWYAFPESFEDVFWRVMKQQTTGTLKLKSFLAFFLADGVVCVGKLTGAELQEKLAPRFLEEARYGSVTHQLDGLYSILEKLWFVSLKAREIGGSEDRFNAVSELTKHFKSVRSRWNAAEVQILEERFPREIPSWRLPTSRADTTSAKLGE